MWEWTPPFQIRDLRVCLSPRFRIFLHVLAKRAWHTKDRPPITNHTSTSAGIHRNPVTVTEEELTFERLRFFSCKLDCSATDAGLLLIFRNLGLLSVCQVLYLIIFCHPKNAEIPENTQIQCTSNIMFIAKIRINRSRVF